MACALLVTDLSPTDTFGAATELKPSGEGWLKITAQLSSLPSSPLPHLFLLPLLSLSPLSWPSSSYCLPLRLMHSVSPGDQVADLIRVSQAVGGLSACGVQSLPQKRNTKLEAQGRCRSQRGPSSENP